MLVSLLLFHLDYGCILSGRMSPDSVEQLRSYTQEFRDWHPPIMG
jgi:hypothetical protein